MSALFLASAYQAQAQLSNSSNTASGSVSADRQKVILKVGELQITQSAFEQYLSDLEAQQGPADLSRQKLGENYASLLVLSQAATAAHLDTSPDVVRQLAIDRTQILSNAEFKALQAKARPTSEQIKSYYNSHLDDYDVVSITRYFVLANPGGVGGGFTRDQAKALADQVRQALSAGKDPMTVINGTPHARTDVVADPEPLSFQRGALPPEMDKAAFGLKEGEWTQVTGQPDEYLFIKLLKRSRKDLEEVSSQIEKKLEAQNLREELDALKKKTGIWMDEAYFASKARVPTTSQPDTSGLGKFGTEKGEK